MKMKIKIHITHFSLRTIVATKHLCCIHFFPLEQSLQQRTYVVSYRIILSEQSLKTSSHKTVLSQ